MSEREITEKELDVAIDLYGFLFEFCIAFLKKLRTADFTNKYFQIRLILTELSYFQKDELSFEDASVGYWVERAEWVDGKSFNLYVTQMKDENTIPVLDRGNAPLQKVTIRREGIYSKPIIPLNFLLVLCSKLRAMACPGEKSQEIVDRYFSAQDYNDLGVYLCNHLNDLSDAIQKEDESLTKIN